LRIPIRPHDKIHVGAESKLGNLGGWKIEFRTGGFVEADILSVFNHANDRGPHFRIGEPRVHSPPNRTSLPKASRQCLIHDYYSLSSLTVI
jgi:hypothetical protein